MTKKSVPGFLTQHKEYDAGLKESFIRIMEIGGRRRSTKSTKNQSIVDYDDYESSARKSGGKGKKRKVVEEQSEFDFYESNDSDGCTASGSERTRLVSINEAFEILRVNIPTFPYERRLSKIDTLHLAISYINLLEAVLESNMSFHEYLRAYLDYKNQAYFNTGSMIRPLWDSSGKLEKKKLN